MYHLSGISSLSTAGRSRSNSIVHSLSPPLSPSVLDFSEYVSRHCEKKLQRRVRQLNTKCNKQQAIIARLKQQLAAKQPQPLVDITNTANVTSSSEQADDTTDDTATVDDGDDTDGVEGEGETTETTEAEQMVPAETADGEDDTAEADEQDELNDSTAHREEGQQRPVEPHEEDLSSDEIVCPPCSPISAGRHKRGRTDDSEQFNTEIIDAQWKKAREDHDESNTDEAQSDEQQPSTEAVDTATFVATFGLPAAAAVPAVQAMLPFKPAFLNPFPMSHLHFQGNNAGAAGALTPYRGLLRPFSAAHQTNSPVAIAQPAL